MVRDNKTAWLILARGVEDVVWANQTVPTDEAGGVKRSGDIQLLIVQLPEVGKL